MGSHHDGTVTAAAFSSSGLLATSSTDGTVRLWDATQLELLRVIRAGSAEFSVRDLSWDHGGATLLLHSTHPELWSAAGERLAVLDAKEPHLIDVLPGTGSARFLAHQGDELVWLDANMNVGGSLSVPRGWTVRELLVPRDRTRAVAIAADPADRLAAVAWDLSAPQALPTVIPFEGTLYAWPSIAPDGASVVLGVADRHRYRVRQISTVSGVASRTLVELERSPEWDEAWTLPIVVASADHSRIAIATEGDVSVVDVRSEVEMLRVTVDDAAVSFDDRGELLAIEAFDGLGVWDVAQARLLWRGWASPIAFSPDSDYLIADELGEVVAVDARTGLRRSALGARVAHPTAAAFIGEDHVAMHTHDGELAIWSLDEASIVTSVEPRGHVLGIGSAHDGGLVVARAFANTATCAPGRGELVVDAFDATAAPDASALPSVGAWPPAPGSRTSFCVPHLRDAVAFDAATGRLVVQAPEPKGDPAPLQVYDLTAGTSIDLADSNDQLETTTSDDGAWVGSIDYDGNASVWSARTGALVARLRMPGRRAASGVEAIAFSTDGSAVAIGGATTTAVYSLPSGALRSAFDAGAPVHTGALAFAPTGELIVGAGARFATYSPAGRLVAASDAGEFGESPAVFSPSGRRAVSLSPLTDPNGLVEVWSPASAEHLASLIEFEDGQHGAVTPGGAYTGTAELSARLGWVFDDPTRRFSFARFGARFGDPEIVRSRLAGGADIDAEIHAPPQLAIASNATAVVDGPDVRLLASAQSTAHIDTIRAYIDGKAVANRTVCAPSGQVELSIPLEPGANHIEVIAYDPNGLASDAAALVVTRL